MTRRDEEARKGQGIRHRNRTLGTPSDSSLCRFPIVVEEEKSSFSAESSSRLRLVFLVCIRGRQNTSSRSRRGGEKAQYLLRLSSEKRSDD